MTVAERIKSAGPKKILALDGGGIRGIIEIEVLGKIETLLRRKLNKGPKFVLADYFDFVAGTSTGAIIGACISLGMSVDRIRDFYSASGHSMFDKASLLKRFMYQYEDTKLVETMKKVYGKDTKLGSDKLRTVLMLVMRNATTDSPWPLSNNPFAKYNLPDRREKPYFDCNLDFPLWQLIRASTAAPVYFPPEKIIMGPNEFIFMDGGVTTCNNPAFQAFLMATTEPYNMNWQAGEDNLLVISVGTGMDALADKKLAVSDMNVLYNAAALPSALISAAMNEQDFLCRTFGKCVCGDVIDREVWDMIGKKGPVSPKLFTYARYNTGLSQEALNAMGLPEIKSCDVQKLDAVDHIHELQKIGKTLAEKKVNVKHFF
ncbi:MAG: patatin-like phospholipase family protein [Spirochaetales bacterium]|nr:patatin-like phospholipase family protein [Spirochaetales bacterium]